VSAAKAQPARRATRAVRQLAGGWVYELIVLQLLISAATLIAGDAVGLVGLALAVAVAAGAIVGVRDLVLRMKRRRTPAIDELEGPPERTRPGVILTLSHDSDAADSAAVLAIRHLRPTYLGFLGTPQTDERRVADHLAKERCPELGVELAAWNAKSWDQLDLRDGTRTVTALIDWMLDRGLHPSDVVVDITGGTKLMSVCAFLAAEAKGIDCEYIRSEWHQGRRRPGSEHFTTIHQVAAR
jgi:CRISPR-associated protein (Cas_Cas02710)